MPKIVIACGETVIVPLLLLLATVRIDMQIFVGYSPSQVYDQEINCTLIVVKFYVEMIDFCRSCC